MAARDVHTRASRPVSVIETERGWECVRASVRAQQCVCNSVCVGVRAGAEAGGMQQDCPRLALS